MAWLTGWKKRRAFQVPISKVGASLTHFPILVKISNSSGLNSVDLTPIFDEVGANSLKIAVTKSDGETQLYVEIQRWDDISEQAWLWVSDSSLSLSPSSANLFYIYYDNTQSDNTTYVGLTRSTPAEAVWDDDFRFVSHMNDNPDNAHIRDSCPYHNDGTKASANNPLQNLTAPIIGSDQSFSGDYISIPDHTSLIPYDRITLEAWVRPYSLTNDKIIGKLSLGPNLGYLLGITGGNLYPEVYDTSSNNTTFQTGAPIVLDSTNYISMTY